MRSPVSTKRGTWTTAPVSSVAGFVTFETVSPRTAGSVRVDGELDGGRELNACGLAVHREHLHRARRREVGKRILDIGAREPELLVRLLVHEVRLGAVVVEELDVLHLRVHARELLSRAERAIDDGARLERLELRPHERTALAGLHVLELDDAPDGAVDLDVHPVAELVRETVSARPRHCRGEVYLALTRR